ncbi:Matrix metalloproteinase-14 [Holothuria leucospilota]|uniref:Matrix metalloproteinase-14 n=1 Tax=Holothuria leucospilota TaxID=206669 RepID=A0A9Q1HCD1_HOLLE|nr:Matrix metalloproteinase-14 [Holothuria leucospilota]
MRFSTIFKVFLLLCLVNIIFARPLNKKGNGKRRKNKKQKEVPIVEPTTSAAPSIDVGIPNAGMREGMDRPMDGAPDMPREDEDGNERDEGVEPHSEMTPHQRKVKARSYMSKYGYLQMMDSDTADGIASEEKEEEVIQMMQMFMGLEPTGKLTEKTMEMLDRPRCGVPDPVMANRTNIRQRRYVHNNLRWDTNELIFRILNYPAEMTREEVRTSIYKAFQVWSNVTPLRFYEVQSGYAHMYLSFGTYSHGDLYPFDGPSGTLAHAYLPKSGFGDLEGDVHFDDSEYFTFAGGDYNTFNLFQVAAHEIGHSLGLSHSFDSSALMAPFYPGYIENFALPYDDILGIASLYGGGYGGQVGPHPSDPSYNPVEPDVPEVPPTTTPPTTTTRATTTTERGDRDPTNDLPPPDHCNQIFDAIGYYRGEIFIFKGDKYWRVRNNTLSSSIDGDLASAFFQDFPGDIDGAYESRQQNRFFVFKGKYYYVYKDLTLESGPTPIRDLNPDLPTDIDTVLSWQQYGKTYFFKGTQVWRFDEKTQHVETDGWPYDISGVWRGVPHNITASFHDEINDYTYFLKGSNYYRYDDYNRAVDNGYPRPFGWDFIRCY